MSEESNTASGEGRALRSLILAPAPRRGRVLVAVSGGCDSTALASLLHRQERCPAMELAWVVQGFRPEDETREGEILGTLAEGLGRRLHVLRTAPPPEWRPGRPIPEEHARTARYRELERLAIQRDLDVVATGHHADDQLETQLLHLARGSGLRGLAAMASTRPLGDRTLWRPLLHLHRVDLAAHLRETGLSWAEDASNEDRRNRRNRARHEWLPRLRRAEDPLIAALPRLAGAARRALERIEGLLEAWRASSRAPTLIPALQMFPVAKLEALRPALLHHLLEGILDERLRGKESVEITTWFGRGGRGVQQTRRSELLRQGPWLCAWPREVAESTREAAANWSRPVADPDRIAAPFASWTLERTRSAGESPWQAAIPPGAIVRTRREGDQVRACRGSRRLSQLFNEFAIPGPERAVWPVLEFEGRVIWVPGLARSAEAPARGANSRVRGIPDPGVRRLTVDVDG